ncbi:hypothetical protein Acsp06_44460 [Actinomycetospora sp. NBRC 106375]|nr:hypothetical protein Acsp06_44460 [Actinomycetospora sp. NBRC 106375]
MVSTVSANEVPNAGAPSMRRKDRLSAAGDTSSCRADSCREAAIRHPFPDPAGSRTAGSPLADACPRRQLIARRPPLTETTGRIDVPRGARCTAGGGGRRTVPRAPPEPQSFDQHPPAAEGQEPR